MSTPFDDALSAIRTVGYHNHRRETHSDIVSDRILADLKARCPAIAGDLASGLVFAWKNVVSPGDRGRKADLIVSEPLSTGHPDMERVRLAIENKSVVTAHRNRFARFDDLTKVRKSVLGAQPKAIVVATVLVGTARKVLNVPDVLKKMLDPDRFEEVRPRLSSGDDSLFSEFSRAVSANTDRDFKESIELFRTLETRGIAETHRDAYDSVLIVPVMIDNVHSPRIERENSVGINVDAEYEDFLKKCCRAYTARFSS